MLMDHVEDNTFHDIRMDGPRVKQGDLRRQAHAVVLNTSHLVLGTYQICWIASYFCTPSIGGFMQYPLLGSSCACCKAT